MGAGNHTFRPMKARSRFALPLISTTITLAPLARYGVAVAAAAVTVALMVLRAWLSPNWGGPFIFIMFMPAIMLSGWIGGAGPGVVATLLCEVAAQYWLLEPGGSWRIADKSELLSIALFVAAGVIISVLNDAWHRSVAALTQSEERLRRTLQLEIDTHANLVSTTQTLRFRTEELERLLEVIPASVWIAKDSHCREVVGNRMAAALLAVSANENISQTPVPGHRTQTIRHFRDGRELSADELPLQLAAASGRPQSTGELEIELPDGQRVTMIGGATPLLDEHGEVCGAVAAYSDVSELISARRALEASDRQKDEFLALLGHELRNPLAPIGTAIELLSRTLPADSRALLAVQIIKRQVSQLTRLVDDLLDVARITQGRMQLQQMPLDLTTVIAQAVETVEPKLRQQQHELSIVRSEGPLYIQGDFPRLVQCVGNILANAVKYTKARGKIRIEMRAADEAAVISISDDGVGISRELLPKVFDLFVQGNRTLERAEGGLGIGLSVVKRLVQMHGGEVTAQSRGLDEGTTIEIRLPRIAPPQESKSMSVRVSAPSRRVLIVDDNADAAESLAMLLNAAGHQAVVALGGQQALMHIASFRPEIALVDIGLPEINGYELAPRLRAQLASDGLKLIAITGYGQQEDRQKALAAGFDHHLVKPVDFAALERAMADPRIESPSSEDTNTSRIAAAVIEEPQSTCIP